MGVSGSGKSTVGRLLARELGCDFADGDDLHPAANRAKLAAGHPLRDVDRAPWLRRIADWIDEHIVAGRPGVIACSALTRAYRDVLRRDEVVFVHLDGSPELLRERLRHRSGHFMPAALLDSQLATLEAPGRDEHAITVEIEAPPGEQVQLIRADLSS